MAKEVGFDKGMMWVDLVDGRRLGVPLAYFPCLLRAVHEQLLQYKIGGGTGLYRRVLDGDIGVEFLLLGDGGRAHVNKVVMWCKA